MTAIIESIATKRAAVTSRILFDTVNGESHGRKLLQSSAEIFIRSKCLKLKFLYSRTLDVYKGASLQCRQGLHLAMSRTSLPRL
jgi:hypothetical protein